MINDPRMRQIADRVGIKFGETAVIAQALVLAEECGEAVQQVRRYKGMARQTSGRADVAEELGDVLISVCVLSKLLGIDLAAAVNVKLDRIGDRGGL